MTDGIIKGTGNSRYLKTVAEAISLYPTYEEFLQALVAGTFPIDLNGINADGWTQIATALNKANLLTDETAALYGLTDENATPNEAFQKIWGAGAPKAGDILTTARTDLGDDWLLCNGVKVSRSVYDKLGGVMPYNLADEWTKETIETSTGSLESITFADGLWVIGGYYLKSSSKYYAALWYSENLEGPWTRVDLWGGIEYLQHVCAICYADNKWVVAGIYRDSSNFYVRAASSSALAGPWATVDIRSASSSQPYVDGIAYGDGYWAFCCSVSTGTSRTAAYLYYTTDLATWTPASLWSATSTPNARAYGLVYGDGYWVACGNTGGSTGTQIAYATSPGGTWTLVPIRSVSAGNAHLMGIGYFGGKWVACGHDLITDTQRDIFIAYADSPDGTWTQRLLQTTEVRNVISTACITHTDAEWVIFGDILVDGAAAPGILYATEPDGEWAASAPIDTNYSFAGAAYHNGGLATISSSQGYMFHFNTDDIYLPAISADHAYVYIKAKE